MANKDAILGVLQQRMDKCATEQFWTVGAITGLDAFLPGEFTHLEQPSGMANKSEFLPIKSPILKERRKV